MRTPHKRDSYLRSKTQMAKELQEPNLELESIGINEAWYLCHPEKSLESTSADHHVREGYQPLFFARK